MREQTSSVKVERHGCGECWVSRRHSQSGLTGGMGHEFISYTATRLGS